MQAGLAGRGPTKRPLSGESKSTVRSEKCWQTTEIQEKPIFRYKNRYRADIGKPIIFPDRGTQDLPDIKFS